MRSASTRSASMMRCTLLIDCGCEMFMSDCRLLSRSRSVANRDPRPRTQPTPHSHRTAAAMGMSVRELGLWFTFIHATGVLLLVPIAFAQQLLPLWAELSAKAGADASYSDLLWSAREQLRVTEPTTLEMFIAAFAGSYYSMDFIMMVGSRAARRNFRPQSGCVCRVAAGPVVSARRRKMDS